MEIGVVPSNWLGFGIKTFKHVVSSEQRQTLYFILENLRQESQTLLYKLEFARQCLLGDI